jgi:hypothetical protein
MALRVNAQIMTRTRGGARITISNDKRITGRSVSYSSSTKVISMFT